jgi:nucleoside-diphosphate-sugar epimerase
VRVLVTGSSGFVGRSIAMHLTNAGHEVIGLGRRLTRSNRQLARAVAADIGAPGLAGRVMGSQRRCEAIVHAAAAVELGDPDAAALSLTNCFGTQQVIELAAGWEVESLVYISSLPVVGRPVELPVRESHPTNPASAYHASKLYGEQLVTLAAARGVPGASLRLTSPVGPNMPDGRILSAFVRRALAGLPLELAGRGTRGQDYVDVRDIAAAVAATIERRATGIFNVASGRCVTNRELAELCITVLGSRSEVHATRAPDPQDDVRWAVSIERARVRLGYEPVHGLDDSIQAVAHELEAHPEAVA